jgi:prolipoprotein diacylglyceryltransferase
MSTIKENMFSILSMGLSLFMLFVSWWDGGMWRDTGVIGVIVAAALGFVAMLKDEKKITALTATLFALSLLFADRLGHVWPVCDADAIASALNSVATSIDLK